MMLLSMVTRQKEKQETFRQCERKARELLARMEVLSRMGHPGRLNEENRKSLAACGAEILDQRPLDSVMERDVVTNYHVRQILRLRRELLEVLNKYPQVVAFGGHLHFPISDERSIMQDKVTNINCGAMSYMATDPGNYRHMRNGTVMKDCTKVSTGYLVQIDKNNNVRFLRMDFFREELIKEPWVIMAPQKDGSHLLSYTKDRGSAENNPAEITKAAIGQRR